LLLIVLCGRSYWHWDTIWGSIGAHKSICAQSLGGRIAVLTFPYSVPWEIGSSNRNETWQNAILKHAQIGREHGILSATGEHLVFAIRDLHLTPGLLALTIAPWIPWSKRFTLRILLIATTLIAIALGLAAWAAK
jgi:hypothetical protein